MKTKIKFEHYKFNKLVSFKGYKKHYARYHIRYKALYRIESPLGWWYNTTLDTWETEYDFNRYSYSSNVHYGRTIKAVIRKIRKWNIKNLTFTIHGEYQGQTVYITIK